MCHHAKGTMEEYVVSAVSKGFRTINFLEHMEEGISTSRVTWLTETDFDRYFVEGQYLKEQYSDKINVGLGVEVGFNPVCEEAILERLAKRSWDFVGVSCHFFKHKKFSSHLNLVSKRDVNALSLDALEAQGIISDYYQNLIRAVDVIPCDMVCHLDAVLRYHPEISSLQIPWDLIDALLNKMKNNGIGLELNTSGLALRGDVFPCRSIIDRAKEMNLSFYAGSDSHSPDTIGQGFNRLADLLN